MHIKLEVGFPVTAHGATVARVLRDACLVRERFDWEAFRCGKRAILSPSIETGKRPVPKGNCRWARAFRQLICTKFVFNFFAQRPSLRQEDKNRKY